MATITLRVPDDDLALIDDAAGANNRTQFMLNAARAAALSVHRARLDAEVGRVLVASAQEDAAVVAEWSVTMGDGIE